MGTHSAGIPRYGIRQLCDCNVGNHIYATLCRISFIGLCCQHESVLHGDCFAIPLLEVIHWDFRAETCM